MSAYGLLDSTDDGKPQERTPRYKVRRSILLAIALALAQAALGYDGQIASIVPTHITTPTSVKPGEHASVASQISTASVALSDMYTFGTIAGAILTLLLGDLVGRKKTLAFGAVLGGLGCLVQTSAFGPAQFITGRALSGIGCGFNMASAPVWQVEATETRLRGRLVLVQIAAKYTGGMIAGWVVLGFPHASDLWRLPVAMQLVFAVGLFILLPMLPESPRSVHLHLLGLTPTDSDLSRWLLKRGRNEKALEALAQLAGKHEHEASIQQSYQMLLTPSEYQHKTPKDYLTSLKRVVSGNTDDSISTATPNRKKWRRACLGALLALFFGFSGLTAFTNMLYTSMLFRVGATNRASAIVSMSGSTLLVLSSILSVALVEILGRRKMLSIAFSGQAICSLAIMLATTVNVEGRLNGYAIAVFAFLFLGFSGFGYGVTWLYQVEINAWNFRLAGSALATIVLYLSNYAIAMSYFRLILRHGWVALFLAINVVAVVCIYLLCPETTGRSLECLDRYFSEDPPLLAVKDQSAIKRKWTEDNEAAALVELQAPKERQADDFDDRHSRSSATEAEATGHSTDVRR